MKTLKEINKEAHFTRRRSIGLASNLDGGILARRKRIEMKYAFLANQLVFQNKVTNERKKMYHDIWLLWNFFLLS